jgi:hypothetical protein
MYLIHLGIGTKDPWTYRFFPTELALFLIGALAHQVLRPIYSTAAKPRLVSTMNGQSAVVGLCAQPPAP